MSVGTQHADNRPLDVTAERMLVTGGSGFLGSHLCRRLVNEGLEVHAVSRSRRSSEHGWHSLVAGKHGRDLFCS